MNTKFIFVTGGVVSGLGKGITAASIGMLLESRGLKVTLMKLDPYINLDAGTMSPFQHGEVFVTADGAETDLDLGHYERYTNAILTKKHNRTTGQIYDAILRKERNGQYLGKTVQVVPHVIDEIKHGIFECAQNVDVAIIEIGGTVGDIESHPFLEAIRQCRHQLGREHTLFAHLTLLMYQADLEIKTKPTQHSVAKLLEIGIQPDFLVCRSRGDLPQEIREKIALFTNVDANCVINAPNVPIVYQTPLNFHKEGFDDKIAKHLGMWTREPQLGEWEKICYTKPKGEVTIAFVGKYVQLRDAYASLNESLIHGGIANSLQINLKYINSEKFQSNAKDIEAEIADVDAILVAPGFGERGSEGKVLAVQYARLNRIPFFGICLGMQIAVIEFARNMAKIPDATSSEFEKEGHCVIGIMQGQEGQEGTGGTMRLGSYHATLKDGTLIAQIYGETQIVERHRHRYEVMNEYVPQLEQSGLIISGRNPELNLVETIELGDHPWFIACQYHPELISKPLKPHPLFVSFIDAAYTYQKEHKNSQ